MNSPICPPAAAGRGGRRDPRGREPAGLRRSSWSSTSSSNGCTAIPTDPTASWSCALRHCDGVGLQALLLVRDDFWMAITRFLRALEVRPSRESTLRPSSCSTPRTRAACWPSWAGPSGGLPDEPGTGPEPDQARFLEPAVKELAGPDGRVIPVRLTLFAEMLRHRDWTTATLRELGGFEGIGVMFLEETFSAPTAPPAHRFHQRAAQAVLKALSARIPSRPQRPAAAGERAPAGRRLCRSSRPTSPS